MMFWDRYAIKTNDETLQLMTMRHSLGVQCHCNECQCSTMRILRLKKTKTWLFTLLKITYLIVEKVV